MNASRFWGFVNPKPTEDSILNYVPFSANRTGKKGVPATLRHMWMISAHPDLLRDKMTNEERKNRLIDFDPMSDIVSNFHQPMTLLPFIPVKKELLYLYKPTINKEDKTITLHEPLSFDDEPTGIWIEGETSRLWRSDLYLLMPRYNVDPQRRRKNRVVLGGFHKGLPLPLRAEVDFIISAYTLSNLLFHKDHLKSIETAAR